jgi:F-type H+-transporting ATPase subunit a
MEMEAVAYHIPYLPVIMLMTGVVWLIIGVLSFVMVRGIKRNPGGLQTVFESAFSYVFDLADQIVGPKHAVRFYPLFAGLAIYILISNLIGLIPFFVSPTSSLNTTYALVAVVFCTYNFIGIKENGWAYFKQFIGPPLPWYFFPISMFLVLTEIISFFVRPFSLGLRLFCNIFSKEIFLSILALLIFQFFISPDVVMKLMTAAPLLLRPAIVLMGIFIGFIQTLVFLVLSMSYIGGAIHAGHH